MIICPSLTDGLEKINSRVQSHVIIVTVYDSFYSPFQVGRFNTLFWNRIELTDIIKDKLYLESKYGVKSSFLSPQPNHLKPSFTFLSTEIILFVIYTRES